MADLCLYCIFFTYFYGVYMLTSINLTMSMQEYNDFVLALNDIRTLLCDLSKEKKSIIYGTKDFSFLRDTIDILFFSMANISDEADKSDIVDDVPPALIDNVLSNDEAHSAIDALQKAIEKTRHIVSRM